jgi:hypothetical protein
VAAVAATVARVAREAGKMVVAEAAAAVAWAGKVCLADSAAREAVNMVVAEVAAVARASAAAV